MLSGCADYLAEKEKIKLEKKQLVYERQVKMDKKTCEHYGFKKTHRNFLIALCKSMLLEKKI